MALIQAPAVDATLLVAGEQALERARGVETIEAAYAAWDEVRAAAAAVSKQWRAERARLEEQGRLLLGAAKVALNLPLPAERGEGRGEGLVAAGPSPGLAGRPLPAAQGEVFVADAQSKLDAALAQLDTGVRDSEAFFAAKLKELRALTLERVTRLTSVQPPELELSVRPVGADKKILHLRRLNEDDSVRTHFVLTGRIPSRYGFLGDDSTDDLGASPPVLYADEGVTGVRAAFDFTAHAEVWPVKGVLVFQLPGGAWARWASRGVVLEAELADGEGWRNVLTAHEAELLTGVLLAHQLGGRLTVHLVRD